MCDWFDNEQHNTHQLLVKVALKLDQLKLDEESRYQHVNVKANRKENLKKVNTYRQNMKKNDGLRCPSKYERYSNGKHVGNTPLFDKRTNTSMNTEKLLGHPSKNMGSTILQTVE